MILLQFRFCSEKSAGSGTKKFQKCFRSFNLLLRDGSGNKRMKFTAGVQKDSQSL